MRVRCINATVRTESTPPEEVNLAQFRRWAKPDTVIELVQATSGPISIESFYDVVFASVTVVREAERAEREGCDAVIVTCGNDPGLYAAREAVSIPVAGGGESAMIAAQILGHRFSIIVPVPTDVLIKTKNAELYGLGHRLASVRPLSIPVTELTSGNPRVFERAVELGRIMVEQDGADVIVLGCGRLTDLQAEIQAAVGVPVVDTRKPAIHMAELMVELQTAPSKRTYISPPKRPIIS